MKRRNLLYLIASIAVILAAAGIPIKSEDPGQEVGLVAGQNVNMVSNTDPGLGDPYLQRQNEPSIAASSRNPLHLLAGANDYRSIDIPFDWEIPGFIFEEPIAAPETEKDAWVGVFKSIDGGLTWTSALLPGFPQDNSPEGAASPLYQNGFKAAADPVVRTGTNGLFFYSGIAFTRGEGQPSSVFVARFIDNNNQEDTETIEYIDTKIIDHSENYIDPTIFLDKPWLATDLPHGVGQKVTINGQQIPRSNVYVVYSVFSGTGDEMESIIMFKRSTDCGETWESPVELSTGHYLNQGATIAVDPRGNGQLCVSWRRFEKETQTNAIVVAISTNGGVDFDRDIVVSEFSEPPFDQPTIPIPFQWPLFRTNTYPTSTMDGEGNIYVAWTKRDMGPNLEANIMISTSSDGLNWSVPKKAITSPDDWTNPYFSYAPGYQFMPSITFAAGKLIMIWYDQRWDLSAWLPPNLPIFNDYVIWEAYQIRHTIDVRAAQAEPSLDPVFSKSIQVSRYRWLDIDGYPFQLEFNMPNLPLFQTGTAPFIGDYVDIVPSPSIFPEGNQWRFNIDPNPSTIYHATWTDNRDVKLAPGDVWGDNYNPPGEGCDPDYTGIRNQNIYTSQIAEGIISSSPGNTKPLNILRAFVIWVKNTTEFEKIVALEKDPDSLPSANFWQAGEEIPSLTATIPPYSSLSATVLVEPYPDENATVVINVLDENNNIISQVTLNPDSSNPEILDPGNWDPQDPALSILYSEIHTPHSRNYDPDNSPILTPHSRNYDLTNELLMNTDLLTPHSRNYDLESSPVLNPHSRNSALEALEGPDEGVEVTDLIWTVENSGNTTSSYSLSTFPVNVPEGVEFQILVYKIYLTPMSMNCNLLEEENHELVVSITNPHSRNDPLEDRVIDGSFHLAPGEQANIIYRVYTPPDSNFDPQSLIPEMIQDVPNVINGVLQSSTSSAVVITTASTPNGVIGQSYSKTLLATGGIEPYEWVVASGELPLGLTLNPSSGEISGSPINDPDVSEYPYTYDFAVQVSDASDPAQTASQTMNIRISEQLVISPVILPEWIVNAEYPQIPLEASGGIGPLTWIISSGQLPPGVNLIQAGDEAVISGTPTSAGSFTCTVDVTDSSNPQQSATLELTAVIYEQLMITTESLEPSIGYLGSPYSATIQATGGLSPYTWEATGQLPPGLNLTQEGNDAIISGTPIYDSNAAYPQTYSFDVTVIESSSVGQQDTLNCSLTIHPKTHQMDAKYEGLGDNKATAMAVDDAGNIYVTGYSRGANTGPDIYTVKYDNNLNKIWSARFDGPSHLGDFGTDIVVKDTYVYVTGYIHRGKQVKHADCCTLKYDNNGNLIWSATYDSRRNGQDHTTAIAVDDDGNVYVTGRSEESLEDEPLRSFDYLTIKYNSSGRMQWEARYEGLGGPTDDEAVAMVVNLGYVYVTGTSDNGSNTDIATIKYDATNGNPVWPGGAIRYDGGYDDGAHALAVDNGFVYVTGFSSNGTDKDFATIKYDATNGSSVWPGGAIRYDGGHDDVANDMVVKDGKVYVTGFSSNGADNDFATIKYEATTGSQIGDAIITDGGYGDDEAVAISVDSFGDIYVTGSSLGDPSKDYFTLKYNSSGSVIWLARYDSASSWDDFATAMIVYSGNVYVAGYSQNPADAQNNFILILKYSN